MKKEFSVYWKGSKQPRKQRKYLAQAPLSVKRKILSAALSKDLKEKYHRGSFKIRKNDVVKILSGKHYGKSGKINFIDAKNMKIAIEGIQETKKDGSKRNVFFKPSRLIITELNLEDKKRLTALQRTLKINPEVKK